MTRRHLDELSKRTYAEGWASPDPSGADFPLARTFEMDNDRIKWRQCDGLGSHNLKLAATPAKLPDCLDRTVGRLFIYHRVAIKCRHLLAIVIAATTPPICSAQFNNTCSKAQPANNAIFVMGRLTTVSSSWTRGWTRLLARPYHSRKRLSIAVSRMQWPFRIVASCVGA